MGEKKYKKNTTVKDVRHYTTALYK